MTNINILQGMACPKCNHQESLYIEARTLMFVTDDGFEIFGQVQWNAHSYTECPDCEHNGTLDDFSLGHVTAELTKPTKE